MSKLWEDQLDLGNKCLERALLPNQFTDLTQSNIYMGGATDIKEHYSFSRWQVNYHTLIYTANGMGILETPTGEHELLTNTAAILPVESSFRLKYNQEDWHFGWVILQDIFIWEALKKQPYHVFFCQQAQIIYHLLCLMYYETELSSRTQSTSSLIQLIHQTLDKKNHQDNKDQSKESENRINQLFQEIEEQLHVPWTVENMSRKVHYSPPHFHRLCLKLFKCSPIQQLIKIRMKRAKYFLEYTDWPISEVASRVGYADPFNFSNRFKKSVGTSPSHYRQESLEKNNTT